MSLESAAGVLTLMLLAVLSHFTAASLEVGLLTPYSAALAGRIP